VYQTRSLPLEVWSFNVGTGINAPPISYSVNGKQYVAVLVGSRQPNNLIPLAPELKNLSTASMLFVFSL
jgi:alcohol dehydrogenase (cytochrome c)